MGVLSWGAWRLWVDRPGNDWIFLPSGGRSGLRCQFRRLVKRLSKNRVENWLCTKGLQYLPFIRPILSDLRHLFASPCLFSQPPCDINNIIFSHRSLWERHLKVLSDLSK